MKITDKQLKQLADGLHPQYIFIPWGDKEDFESLIVSLAEEIQITRKIDIAHTLKYAEEAGAAIERLRSQHLVDKEQLTYTR